MGDWLRDTKGWNQAWAERKQVYARARRRGDVLAMYKGQALQIVCGDDPAWREGARDLGATWHPKTGIWSFKRSQRRAVAQLVARVYGAEKVPDLLQETAV